MSSVGREAGRAQLRLPTATTHTHPALSARELGCDLTAVSSRSRNRQAWGLLAFRHGDSANIKFWGKCG